MRAHVVLPEELVEEVDRLAGKRRRSQVVEEAIREKLGAALRESAGALSPGDYPEWSTPERTSEWVRSMRQRDLTRLFRTPSAPED